MVAQVLREGFAQAHRRPGLIFLDVLWKVVWLAITIAGLLIVAYGFGSHLEWRSSNIRPIDAWVLARQLRQLFSEYGGQFLGGLTVVLGLSAVAYLGLEASFRRRLVLAERGLKPATTSLIVFIASNVVKLAFLSSSAVLLGLIVYSSAYARVAGLVTFVGFAFFLTLLDTLIRTDAVELLGADLLCVAGLIGALLLFEALIGASLTIAVVFGFLNVSNVREGFAMIVVTTLVLFIFNFLHSYLLVVRFSAVGIMRRNVIDV